MSRTARRVTRGERARETEETAACLEPIPFNVSGGQLLLPRRVAVLDEPRGLRPHYRALPTDDRSKGFSSDVGFHD